VHKNEFLPPWSSFEEGELITQLADSNRSAYQTLIERNLRFVIYTVRKFENVGVEIEDLISIGTIGLIKAINTFRPDEDVKLAKYASQCIENEILAYLHKS